MEQLVAAVADGLRAMGLDASAECGRTGVSFNLRIDGQVYNLYGWRRGATRVEIDDQLYTKVQSVELTQYIVLQWLPAALERRHKQLDYEQYKNSLAVAVSELRNMDVRLNIERERVDAYVGGTRAEMTEFVELLTLWKFSRTHGCLTELGAMVRATVGESYSIPARVYADYLEENYPDRYKDVEKLRELADRMDKQ